MTYDFTIPGNEAIRNFFYGSDHYIPTNEIVYLGEHPLIRPNFMTEIEDLVKQTGDFIVTNGLNGFALDELTNYAITLGNLLPDITRENAKETLMALRGVYTLCNDITPRATSVPSRRG